VKGTGGGTTSGEGGEGVIRAKTGWAIFCRFKNPDLAGKWGRETRNKGFLNFLYAEECAGGCGAQKLNPKDLTKRRGRRRGENEVAERGITCCTL